MPVNAAETLIVKFISSLSFLSEHHYCYKNRATLCDCHNAGSSRARNRFKSISVSISRAILYPRCTCRECIEQTVSKRDPKALQAASGGMRKRVLTQREMAAQFPRELLRSRGQPASLDALQRLVRGQFQRGWRVFFNDDVDDDVSGRLALPRARSRVEAWNVSRITTVRNFNSPS